MWFIMELGTRFQSALNNLRNDAREIAKDLTHYFEGMSNETRILFFVMFIMTIFYLVVRRSEEKKEPGGAARQFVYALAIILIFGIGLGWAMDQGPTQITRI